MITRVSLLRFWRRECRLFLAFFWTAGWGFGSWFGSTAEEFVVALMRRACEGNVSIVSLLFVTLLPFLISTFVVLHNAVYLLLPLAFCKAFLISNICCAVAACFGSAGWLVGILLLFSEFCAAPVLYGFWRRHISGRQSLSVEEILGFCVWIFLIGSINFRIISPFLASLIDH